MERSDNKKTIINLSVNEIKIAIVDYVKQKHPDLQGIKPHISFDIDVYEKIDLEGAILKFEL